MNAPEKPPASRVLASFRQQAEYRRRVETERLDDPYESMQEQMLREFDATEARAINREKP